MPLLPNFQEPLSNYACGTWKPMFERILQRTLHSVRNSRVLQSPARWILLSSFMPKCVKTVPLRRLDIWSACMNLGVYLLRHGYRDSETWESAPPSEQRV